MFKSFSKYLLRVSCGILLIAQLTWANPLNPEGDKIRMIGFDQNGKPIQLFVSQDQYATQVSQSISTFEASLLPVLEKRAQNSQSQARSRKPWSLNRVVVGTGIGVEIGLGPVAQIGIFPRFRIIFGKSRPVLDQQEK